MTGTPELEWDHWQVALRSDPPAAAMAIAPTAELQRRLRRHGWLARVILIRYVSVRSRRREDSGRG